MKKISILLFLIVFTLQASAQLSGEVMYATKINMHKKLPDNEHGERMRQYMPEFIEVNNQLLFTSTETVFKNIHEEVEETVGMENSKRGHNFMIKRMAPPNDIIYTNIEKQTTVQKKEFMDKVFLIKDSLSSSQWKFTGEMKTVSGMNCMKAEFIPSDNDTNIIFAWFTPEIPVSSGPAGYGGLPGLIVHIDINDGQMQISLLNIVMRDIKEGEIVEPLKGKDVTMEEYKTIMRKKMEQQRKQYEGYGKGGHYRH